MSDIHADQMTGVEPGQMVELEPTGGQPLEFQISGGQTLVEGQAGFPLSPERTQLVLDNLGLAYGAVKRYNQRRQIPAYEDLAQEACNGLVVAAGRFDPSRGIEFAAYASPYISGYVKKAFRDSRLVRNRQFSDHYQELDLAEMSFQRLVGRRPTIEELAHASGLAPRVVRTYRELQGFDSLDKPIGEDGMTRADTIADGGQNPEETVVERETLEQAITDLPETMQTIIRQRYLALSAPSQAEVAGPLGIHQVHVSRLERKALNQLREALGETDDEPSQLDD